jgi:hypothetical protein
MSLAYILFGFESNSQSVQNCLCLQDVIKKINATDFKDPDIGSSKRFTNFDFVSFLPFNDSMISPNDYFVAHFDNQGKVRAVEHFENAPRFSKFKSVLFDFEAFRLYTIQSGESTNYYPAVFIVNKKSQQSYYINLVPQFDERNSARMDFDGVPKVSLHRISSIMLLNNRFYPEVLLRFSTGRLVLGSDILYEDDKSTLKGEIGYIMLTEKGDTIEITGDMCLAKLSTLSGNIVLRFPLTPNIPWGNASLPLWVWGGAHYYSNDGYIQRSVKP